MSFDVERYLGAVTRTVTAYEQDGQSMRAVTLARSFKTDVGDLWDAATNTERLPRWFLPVTGDLKPGGRYQLEGNAEGTIQQCEPPSFLALTWEFGGEMSWVEARMSAEADDHARLTLTHIAPVSEFWEQYGAGAGGVGWDLGLVALAYYLSTGKVPFTEESFSTSPEGKAFIVGSSNAWGEAQAASGESREQAMAAARETLAFYTGESS